MITSPFGQRKAEQFDDLLEGRIDDAPEELTRLLGFAERVWALPSPEPRPEFSASLRERLMAEAPSAMAQGATDNRLTIAPIVAAGDARRRRRIAAVVAVASIGAAATGTAFAADDALPGETLYPIKRLVESAHSAISLGDQAKGTTELSHARTRLAEATALAQAGQSDRAAEALDDFVADATKGADLLTSAGTADPIHDFTTSSVSDLNLLSTLLPSTVVAPVLQALVGLDQAATTAFPDSEGGITSLPGNLVQMLSAALGGGATTPTTGAPLSPAPGTKTPATPATAVPTRPGGQTTKAPAPGASPGAGKPASPRPTPSTLGEAVSGVGDAVGNGVVGGLGGALSSTGASVGGPVGGLVSGVGDAVTGVGGAVNDLLGGVGSLLTPPSSTPK